VDVGGGVVGGEEGLLIDVILSLVSMSFVATRKGLVGVKGRVVYRTTQQFLNSRSQRTGSWHIGK
jgi:hypothetical protein